MTRRWGEAWWDAQTGPRQGKQVGDVGEVLDVRAAAAMMAKGQLSRQWVYCCQPPGPWRVRAAGRSVTGFGRVKYLLVMADYFRFGVMMASLLGTSILTDAGSSVRWKCLRYGHSPGHGHFQGQRLEPEVGTYLADRLGCLSGPSFTGGGHWGL